MCCWSLARWTSLTRCGPRGILRHRTDWHSGKATRQTVYALTDLATRQASPQRLGQLARSQWVIGNRLRFVRDTTSSEDAPKIRTGHGPDNIATLRSPDAYPPGTSI
ncbi:hypothetical protein ACFV6N_41135, partial [Streptomyces sp. NPDC059819]